MNNPSLSPYFTQTSQWADFWAIANYQAGHQVHTISVDGQVQYLYQYPYYFGESFLYAPSSPVFDDAGTTTNDLATYLDAYYSAVIQKASELDAVFVKTELDPIISQRLNINDNMSGKSAIQSYVHDSAVTIARKRIMYNAAIVLDTSQLLMPNEEKAPDDTESLKAFFYSNSVFWKKVNAGHRSKTKKSLDQGWQYSVIKSEENFESFWKLYQSTAQRQTFTTQPREYFQALYEKPESRIIVLFDEDSPQAVWFGYVSGDSLIYLYGGNTRTSMERYGQYFIHLIALRICTREKLQTYDLGGYEPGTGYSVFKERYKGTKIDFFGPYDIVLRPIRYKMLENIITIAKPIRRLLK